MKKHVLFCAFLLFLQGLFHEIHAREEQMNSPATVSPYLNHVIDSLKEFKAVSQAKTAQEKQNALLKIFQKRKSKPASLCLETQGTMKKQKITAENALKHIFPGQPAYPPQFRGKDTIDWDSNPFKDYEWLWQFHRFYWLPAMSASYRETGDERYVKEWSLEINSYVRHMHDPKIYKKHAGWRSLDTAIRLKIWADTFDTFIHSKTCDSYTLVNFLYSVKCHAEYMMSLPLNESSNWTVYQLEALLTAAVVFPEFRDREKWAQKAIHAAINIQNKVILPDGVISEYIPSYHMSYPGQFLSFLELTQNNHFKTGFPESYCMAIEKMIQAVMLWSHPDGTSPMFGDSWMGRENANRIWMKSFLAKFPHRADFRWFATNGKQGTMPEQINYSLPNAGYHILRSGWGPDDVFIILKNTRPIRPEYHNQDDNLTFELSAFGSRLMTDSGCYNYTGEPKWREWFRSPQAHQLISIDNQPISGKKAAFIARKTYPQAEAVILENEPYPGLLHRRIVILLDKRFILLVDRVSGSMSGKLRQHFQFAPGEWGRSGNTVFTKHPGKVNLCLISAKQRGITFEEEEGWISYYYMKKEKRPAFAFVQSKEKDRTIMYLTALIPFRTNTDLPVSELKFTDDSGREIVFSADGKIWQIRLAKNTMLPDKFITATDGKKIKKM